MQGPLRSKTKGQTPCLICSQTFNGCPLHARWTNSTIKLSLTVLKYYEAAGTVPSFQAYSEA